MKIYLLDHPEVLKTDWRSALLLLFKHYEEFGSRNMIKFEADKAWDIDLSYFFQILQVY